MPSDIVPGTRCPPVILRLRLTVSQMKAYAHYNLCTHYSLYKLWRVFPGRRCPNVQHNGRHTKRQGLVFADPFYCGKSCKGCPEWNCLYSALLAGISKCQFVVNDEPRKYVRELRGTAFRAERVCRRPVPGCLYVNWRRCTVICVGCKKAGTGFLPVTRSCRIVPLRLLSQKVIHISRSSILQFDP